MTECQYGAAAQTYCSSRHPYSKQLSPMEACSPRQMPSTDVFDQHDCGAGAAIADGQMLTAEAVCSKARQCRCEQCRIFRFACHACLSWDEHGIASKASIKQTCIQWTASGAALTSSLDLTSSSNSSEAAEMHCCWTLWCFLVQGGSRDSRLLVVVKFRPALGLEVSLSGTKKAMLRSSSCLLGSRWLRSM